EALQPERDLTRPPVLQVLFVLQSFQQAGLQSLDLPGLRLEPFEAVSSPTTLDLAIEATETPAGLSLIWKYNADLLEPATIDRLHRHFEALLEAVAAAPGTRLSLLTLLTAAERQQLVREWSDSAEVFPGPTFVQLFAAQAAARPGETAATDGAERLTYG